MNDQQPVDVGSSLLPYLDYDALASLARGAVQASRRARRAGEAKLERTLLDVAAEATNAALARKRLP